MNVIAEIQRINARELELGVGFEASWHQKYKDSAWVYAGGLPFELTEGDVLCVLSQFGEIEDVNLVRDPKTGKSKGFAFVKYENWLSTVLAVDNMNGARLLERTVRVDHVLQYKLPKEVRDREEERAARLLSASSDEEGNGSGNEGEGSSSHRPRGLPGHAYEGKELATAFDIARGQNVFDAPPESKEEKKKRKKEHRTQELTQAQWMEQVRLKRQAQREQEARERSARIAAGEPEDAVAPQPSETGWRGRLEPTANEVLLPKRSRRDQEDGDSEAAFRQREQKRRAAYGGIGRTR